MGYLNGHLKMLFCICLYGFISGLIVPEKMQGQGNMADFSSLGSYEFQSVPFYSAYTALFDKNGKDYLYAAAGELGFLVFDISTPSAPEIVFQVAPAALNGLRVMNLYLHGDYAYASLGGFAGVSQAPGLAIFDISSPSAVFLTDFWQHNNLSNGAPVVVSDGEFAFIGAMEDGLLILDVTDKSDIHFAGQFMPDPNFPEPPTFLSQPAARGLALRNDTLFVCNDAKGFRMIDVSNKLQPVELAKHMNWPLHSNARPAYNDVVLVENYAYVSVDYCGLEVVKITSAGLETVHWFNPWECSTTNWACSEGHTNQVRIIGDSMLFISGADTEVMAFDIRDRENPVWLGSFGEAGNLSVTWGIDARDNHLALAHFHWPFTCGGIVPYQSNWGGIQLLEWSYNPVLQASETAESLCTNMMVYPNPAQKMLYINTPEYIKPLYFRILNLAGRTEILGLLPENEASVSLEKLAAGVYVLVITDKAGNLIGREIVLRY